MSGFGPVGATPVGAGWPATRSRAASGRVRVRDLAAAETLWAVEISAPGGSGSPRPAPFGLVAALPVAAGMLPRIAAAAGTPAVYASDRGWIGEPDDPDAPNQSWPPRLIEPPALLMALPVYPGEGRRAETTAGEIMLANTDGGLDALAGDWGLAGRRVVIRRGPHRRPLHARAAEIGRVAELRVRAALDGDSQLRLTLQSGAADLSVPACATYAGTGGPEGGADLAGQPKPRLYGVRRNFVPVLLDAGRQLYQLHDGPVAEVLAVRNRAVPQVFAGNAASYAALMAAVVPDGGYMTCLSTGHVRLGSDPSIVTAAARGDVLGGDIGYAGGTPASIAAKLLRGPGGVPAAMAYPDAFASWPVAEAGLLVTGGTVAEAMERLAAGVAGWWGADAFGGWRGGVVTPPEEAGATLALEPWMLAAPPAEVPVEQAPWYRARASYRSLDRVMTGEDVAPVVSDADRAMLAQASRLAPPAIDLAMQRLPAAQDGAVLDTVFDAEAPAVVAAQRMLALAGRPRRSWRLTLRSGAGGVVPQMVLPGTVLTLTWPGIAALRQPRPLLVRELSLRGDDLTLTVWG